MRVLLAFQTALGSRTLIAEGGDPDSARGIAEAHRAQGFNAHVMEDEGRYDMRAHLKRNKLKLVKAARLDPKIVEIRSRDDQSS